MEELDLTQIRQQIDECDRKLADVLQQRLSLVTNVAAYKKNRGIPVKDMDREKQIIDKVVDLVSNAEYKGAVKSIMHCVIDQSCSVETAAIDGDDSIIYEIGCFGSAGSFTHQALEDFFKGKDFHTHHYNTFDEVIGDVSSGAMDYAVLPIENSSTGGITEVYDLLRKYDCHIVGEQQVKIEQNLIGLKGAKLSEIRTVYSHPQGFKQSKEFFKDYPNIRQVPFFSTSRSAEEIAIKQDPTIAAVASKKAAELYGLEILASAVNHNSNNCTRFVIVSSKGQVIPNANKITLIVSIKHETGSLYKMLASFYHTGLNLLNLESRPMEGKSWEYFFYIDLSGNLNDPLVIDVMNEIKEKCTYCKILGNYCAFQKMD